MNLPIPINLSLRPKPNALNTSYPSPPLIARTLELR